MQIKKKFKNNNTLKVATVGKQIITELSEIRSEKCKITIIVKMVLNARVHRPLKVIALNANNNWGRRYELSKQLQDSQRHISSPMRDSLFQNITFIGLTASWEEKASP
jgi:hypothetical protein